MYIILCNQSQSTAVIAMRSPVALPLLPWIGLNPGGPPLSSSLVDGLLVLYTWDSVMPWTSGHDNYDSNVGLSVHRELPDLNLNLWV